MVSTDGGNGARSGNKQTRGQGLDPVAFPALRLLGGRLCLDFANSVEDRATPGRTDYLRSYPDLVRWGRHAGLLTVDGLLRLLAEAEERPEDAAVVFAGAVALREAIARVFRAVARGAAPVAPDLDVLRRSFLDAMGHARLANADGAFAWVWIVDGVALDRVLWPVARSAVVLLTEGNPARVKECPGADDCGWLFYDASKNGTRRWCSMEGCGSRVKMRRHHARTKLAAGVPA